MRHPAAFLAALAVVESCLHAAGLLVARNSSSASISTHAPLLKFSAKEGSEAGNGASSAKAHTQHKTSSKHTMHPCLAGKRIVFIGPSTSKADYIALAYFAEYGVWPVSDIIAYGAGQWGPNPIHEAGVQGGHIPVSP